MPKKSKPIQFTNWSISTRNAYLSSKGYTIPKADIPQEALEYMRTALMAKPYTPGAPVTSTDTLFPIYRESPQKIYIPRHFGEHHFGVVPSKLPSGDTIQLTFNGALRDYQAPVINKFLDYVHSGGSGGLLELYTAWGKTGGALYIIAALKKKTLIVVQKEFLLNQWVERIHQFLPTARIGRIQGPIVDIVDKDIVICMLQSVSKRVYPDGTFTSFGLLVVDEVHHISSESFSNALFRIVVPYTLGLSATMDRKDGTSYVFKQFLGEIIHTAQRDATSGAHVTVHAITYSNEDPSFNAVPIDRMGNPQMSTMISTICGFAPRTEFILRVLTDFISKGGSMQARRHKLQMDCEVPICLACNTNRNYPVKLTCCGALYCLPCIENENLNPRNAGKAVCPNKHCAKKPRKLLQYTQQYMENPFVQPVEERHTLVLALNLTILKYMYQRIVCRNLASVGYYVGGMKETALKQSEKCQVILATFQMAAEALDIPSLNALLFISPKTDIVQSVGRILRSKHTSPTIVDIVDTHDIFRNQARKRIAYYKKQGYAIMYGKSNTFSEPYFAKDVGVGAGADIESGSDLDEDDAPPKSKLVALLKARAQEKT